MAVVWMDPVNVTVYYQTNLKSVASPVPEIIAIDVLGLRTPSLGEEEAV